MTSPPYPLQTLELQQQPHPFAVNDDKDLLQSWREAYHIRLNNNTDPIPAHQTKNVSQTTPTTSTR